MSESIHNPADGYVATAPEATGGGTGGGGGHGGAVAPVPAGSGGRILDEGPIGLSAAMRHVPPVNGHHPKPSTGWRWCQGLIVNGQRVALEHIFVGRRLYTSRAALGRFFAALAAARATREQTVTDAERRLRAAGFYGGSRSNRKGAAQ